VISSFAWGWHPEIMIAVMEQTVVSPVILASISQISKSMISVVFKELKWVAISMSYQKSTGIMVDI